MAGAKTEHLIAKETVDSVTEAILRQTTTFQECYGKKDFKGISEVYTEDCKFCPPGVPKVNGREELVRHYQKMRNEGVARFTFSDQEIFHPGGDKAVQNGKFKVFDTEDRELDQGKFLAVWKRVGGQWCIHFDLFNTDLPKKEPSLSEVLDERLTEIDRCWKTGDVQGVGNFFTPDCKFFPPGAPVCLGREAATRFLRDTFGTSPVQTESVSLERHKMADDLIADHGTWAIYDKDGAKHDHGSVVAVWKKLDDGKWYVHYDAFNSEMNPRV